jgi:hypothetical protein
MILVSHHQYRVLPCIILECIIKNYDKNIYNILAANQNYLAQGGQWYRDFPVSKGSLLMASKLQLNPYIFPIEN